MKNHLHLKPIHQPMIYHSKITAANTGLAKVAVKCSIDTFVVNQSLVLRLKICGENRHLRQARKRYAAFQ